MNQLKCFTGLLLIFFIQQKISASPFQQQDGSAKIEGTIAGATIGHVVIDSLSVNLDQEGNFQLQIPLKQAEYLALEAGNAQIDLYAQPQSHIIVEFEEGNMEETISFNGDNAAINRFLFDQRKVSEAFNSYFNKNANSYLYKLPEPEFVRKMDSLQSIFLEPLQELSRSNKGGVAAFIKDYKKDIELSFLAFLADYPILYLKNTGDSTSLSKSSKAQVESIDLNDFGLHKYDGFQGLLKNFLYQATNRKLEKGDYSESDNKRLDAGFAVIKRKFTNQKIFEKVLFDFLLNHIENLGVKNIEENISFFNKHVRNQQFKDEVNELYEEEVKRRQGHIIRTYKKVDGYSLDAHILCPIRLNLERNIR